MEVGVGVNVGVRVGVGVCVLVGVAEGRSAATTVLGASAQRSKGTIRTRNATAASADHLARGRGRWERATDTIGAGMAVRDGVAGRSPAG